VRELAARLLDVRARLGRSVAVGISGIDCAGKSTLAASLRRELERSDVPALVISGDAFTRPSAERHAERDEGLGYYRDSFDYAFLFNDLLPAVRSDFSGELHADVSDWEGDTWRGESFVVTRGAIVIVEGGFLFKAANEVAFDFRVWIDLPIADAIGRALERPRDLARMGGPSGVREQYIARYLPGQRLHIDRDGPQQRADLVLDARAMMCA
jgi:uridine kinase